MAPFSAKAPEQRDYTARPEATRILSDSSEGGCPDDHRERNWRVREGLV
jgi:hypothetical protein